MRIVRIRVKNYLGLTDFEMKQPGRVNVVRGRNATGKTSVLRAIRAAFKGDGPQAIRLGANKAEILVDCDELRVERVITPKTPQGRLKVEREGLLQPRPQTFLDGLIGDFAFNPIEFFLADGKRRRDILLSCLDVSLSPDDLRAWGVDEETLVELDFSKHPLEVLADAQRLYYDRRRAANRNAQKLRSELGATRPAHIGQPEFPAPRTRSQWASELAATVERERELERESAELQERALRRERLLSEARMNDELAGEKMRRAADARSRAENCEARIESLRAEADSLRAQAETINVPGLNALRAEIERLQRMLADGEAALRRKESLLSQAAARDEQASELAQQLVALRGDEDMARREADELARRADARRNEAAALDADEERRREVMRLVQETRVKRTLVEEALRWAERREQAQAAEREAGELDSTLQRLRAEGPRTILSRAEFPIKGLEIKGDMIRIDGKRLDDLSGAEQLKLALDIARRLNRRFKIICVDDIGKLDEESFRQFVELTQNDGYQYWVARVDETDLEVQAVE